MSAEVCCIKAARNRKMVREAAERRLADIVKRNEGARMRSERLHCLLEGLPWNPDGGTAA